MDVMVVVAVSVLWMNVVLSIVVLSTAFPLQLAPRLVLLGRQNEGEGRCWRWMLTVLRVVRGHLAWVDGGGGERD